MKKLIQSLLSLLPLFFINYAAHADGINLSLVNTHYNYTYPADVYLDDSSTGFGLSYIFQLNPSWALDLGYTNYGSGTRTIGTFNTEAQASSINLTFRGTAIIGTIGSYNINAHGLLGAAMGTMEVTAGGVTLSDSDTGLVYGVGLGASLTPLDEIVLMYKKADLDFNNTVNFEYNPVTIELGYTRRF